MTGFLRFTYFHELTGRLNIGPDDTITLLRQDGVVIMRRPFDMDVIGKDMSHLPSVQKVLASLSGSFRGKGGVDEVDRLYVWRDASHPLIAVVGLSLDGIYGRWRREALQIVAASAILGLLTLFGAVCLARQMKRRFAAEQKLNHLATTDGLTGLANRRHFDEILKKEWSRATREKTCVALLMIDADHFKSYNDLFGHQAGDDVLTNIAACIFSVPKRSTDCCARYGGEEFAVVLPGLSLSEAARLGEQIRLQVLLQPSEHRTVTVSVGVASAFPMLGQSFKDLIRIADAALYRAKEQGRNRTFAHGIGQARLVA